MAHPPPSREPHFSALHLKVCAGDAVAREQLAAELLQLLRYDTGADSHDARHDAVVDAILEYLRRPERFDPARGIPLESYLRFASMRNLQNRRRREMRRVARERQYAEEAERERVGFHEMAGDIPASLAGVCGPGEIEAVVAWSEGERRTVAFASLLRLGHMDHSEQRAEIKRFKDRLKRRFTRLAYSNCTRKNTAEVELELSAGNFKAERREPQCTRFDSPRGATTRNRTAIQHRPT